MKSMSGKELAKLLEANGWDLLRIQGSHHIYGQAGNPVRISVPKGMMETTLLSETILQEDWLKPAEEVAWQDL